MHSDKMRGRKEDVEFSNESASPYAWLNSMDVHFYVR